MLRRARPSLHRRHGGTPARRLIPRRRTPHRCSETLPRISTTYAHCRPSPQTTYDYGGRTNTYTEGRVVGPSVVTLRNRYTFVILRKAGTAASTAGTRLAIRPGMNANRKPEGEHTMTQREFQIRIACYDGEEFAECFTTKKEALKAYQRRLQQSEYDCVIELIEVLAQHTISGTNSSDGL